MPNETPQPEALARELVENWNRAHPNDPPFVYWPGEREDAPDDWDGGAYLCRDGKTYVMCGYSWRHGDGAWVPTADWDRIGYRLRPAAVSNEQVARALHWLAKQKRSDEQDELTTSALVENMRNQEERISERNYAISQARTALSALAPAQEEKPDTVATSVYEAAYRQLLPVLRAAEHLSRLWRTNGQRVDDDKFFDAINAVDVAVCGGRAKPEYISSMIPAEPSSEGEG